MPYFTQKDVQKLKDDGFDESTLAKGNERISVKCSQCDSRVISGVPCHEHGCPNWKRKP